MSFDKKQFELIKRRIKFLTSEQKKTNKMIDREVELLEDKLNHLFKIGNRVKILYEGLEFGKLGTVTHIQNKGYILVKIDGEDYQPSYTYEDLEVIE